MELKFSAVILQNKDMDAAYCHIGWEDCRVVLADRESCVARRNAALENLLQIKQRQEDVFQASAKTCIMKKGFRWEELFCRSGRSSHQIMGWYIRS